MYSIEIYNDIEFYMLLYVWYISWILECPKVHRLHQRRFVSKLPRQSCSCVFSRVPLPSYRDTHGIGAAIILPRLSCANPCIFCTNGQLININIYIYVYIYIDSHKHQPWKCLAVAYSYKYIYIYIYAYPNGLQIYTLNRIIREMNPRFERLYTYIYGCSYRKRTGFHQALDSTRLWTIKSVRTMIKNMPSFDAMISIIFIK